MDSCDTLNNLLSANQLFSLIDVKRKFINSDNHKFHQYQENDYLSSSLNLSRRDCMAVEKVEVIFICTESENRRRSQGIVCHCHQAIFFK
jgi:uncharacterized protein (UPF0276 family)